MWRVSRCLVVMFFLLIPGLLLAKTDVISLDGTWQFSFDSRNCGKEEKWWEKELPSPKEVKIPSPTPQQGWGWYSRTFVTPQKKDPKGRVRLKFWQVHYYTEVWLNGIRIGDHEGAQDPFLFDITESLKPAGEENRLVVRVMHPGSTATPPPFEKWSVPRGGGSCGILDSVELYVSPETYIDDLHLIPNCQSGEILTRVRILNTGSSSVRGSLTLSAVLSKGSEIGNDDAEVRFDLSEIKPGENVIEKTIPIPNVRLWNLNDPNLYFVTARLEPNSGDLNKVDEKSDRCGFRDIRFENGFFRLNGKRIYIKSSHSGAITPITGRIPFDPDILRRDLLYSKAMNFNMIRFIGIEGVARRFQLDMCDEIGLMVFEESCIASNLAPSPWLERRVRHEIEGMLLRDRNHPSIVFWGLLNEISHHGTLMVAEQMLSRVKELAPGRIVFFNSGSFDPYKENTQQEFPFASWRTPDTLLPFVAYNLSGKDVPLVRGSIPNGALAMMPHVNMHCAAVRWTAPEEGTYLIKLRMKSLGPWPTIYKVLHEKKVLVKGEMYFNRGPQLNFSEKIFFKKNESFWITTLNESPSAIDMKVQSETGKVYDLKRDFQLEKNPNGPWAFGMRPMDRFSTTDFDPFTKGESKTRINTRVIGRISNPGATEWQDIVADLHRYVHYPYTTANQAKLKDLDFRDLPIFLSEFGVDTGCNLTRLARFYEQYSATNVGMYGGYLNEFKIFSELWKNWKLEESFASPEDYFSRVGRWSSELRRIGVNALRANPQIISYSLTGTSENGCCGEGVTTAFREPKNGVVDTMLDLFAPLRFCTFIEPNRIYAGQKAKFELVLVNEDALAPGTYPARVTISGPKGRRIYDKTIDVVIPKPQEGKENPFAISVFKDEVVIDGPVGEYRLRADLLQGGASSGGLERFFVFRRDTMPENKEPCYVWGEDKNLLNKLSSLSIKAIPFEQAEKNGQLSRRSERAPVILVAANIAAKYRNKESFARLFQLAIEGANIVILEPYMLEISGVKLPFDGAESGTIVRHSSGYTVKQDWNKYHPFFEGLPAGDILDPICYQEILPEMGIRQCKTPDDAVAGTFFTSGTNRSFLTLARWNIGKGALVFNSFRIQNNLGVDPVAELLLRNIIHSLEK